MSTRDNELSDQAVPYRAVPTVNFFLYPPLEPVAGGSRSITGDLGLGQRMPDGTTFVAYVSVPYCRSRCNSCCCFRGLLPRGDHPEAVLDEYVDCLVAQTRAYAATARFSSSRCGAIYVGGGTASVLSPAQLDRLLRAMRDAFVLADDVEIDLEGSPVDLTREYLAQVKQSGVTRVSIGYQSAQQGVLEALHTFHGSEASLAAASNALAAGFGSVNVDLLFNVPGQTESQWHDDLAIVLDMRPPCISIGDYTVFPGTRAERLLECGQLPAQHTVDEAYAWYRWGCEQLERHGYHEQVRGIFCQPSHEQKYVRLCCNESCEIVALGAGAFGFVNRCQFRTTSDSERYKTQVRNESFHVADAVSVQATARNLMERYIIHNLYSAVVDRREFLRRFGRDPVDAFPEIFSKLSRFELIAQSDGEIRLTELGKKWRKNVYQEFHSCRAAR